MHVTISFHEDFFHVEVRGPNYLAACAPIYTRDAAFEIAKILLEKAKLSGDPNAKD